MAIKNILVTGAAGCVGSNLVRRLAENKNNNIHILIEQNTWHPYLTGLDLTIHYGDIRNKKDVYNAMKDCDSVYQIAGVISYFKLDNYKVYSTHVDGVRNILDNALALKIKKVIVTASTAGIGISKGNDILSEKTPFNIKKYKKNMYMYSKYKCIQLCKEYAKKGLSVCTVSPTTIYGQGDIHMHLGSLLKSIASGRLTYAPPGGNSVVTVDDIIDAHILVMEKGIPGENYIFANEFIPYYKMYTQLAALLNSKHHIKKLPHWTLLPFIIITAFIENILLFFKIKPPISPASINFLYKNRHFSAKKAKKELGWQPRITFKKAIKKSIAFYREEKLL